MAKPTQAAAPWWRRPMTVVTGATAVLGLVFALQRLVGSAGDWRGRRHRVSEYLALAAQQRESRDYAAAWASLDSAAQLERDDDRVLTAREDLAMEWLRAARVREGEQTFTALVRPLLPVLERGVLRAQGARKADLIAHTGWADFLRWREGAVDLSPPARYQRALEVDPKNPFAHAMWGHWILFTGGDMNAARAHFDAALGSGRERPYVRSLQLAALLNSEGSAAADELLRVASQARLQNDSVGADSRARVFTRVCLSDVSDPGTWSRSTSRIAPADEIATLRWLVGSDTADTYRRDMLRFCEARAHATATETGPALEMLRDLEAHAAGDATRAAARAAAARLAAH